MDISKNQWRSTGGQDLSLEKKSETKMRATKYSNLFSFILTNLTSLRASENFTTWEDLLKNPLIKLVLPKIIELGIAQPWRS